MEYKYKNTKYTDYKIEHRFTKANKLQNYKTNTYIGEYVAIVENCTMETSIPGTEDTLQYAFLLVNKGRSPNETVNVPQ